MIKKIFLFSKLIIVFIIPFQLIFLYKNNAIDTVGNVAGIQKQQTIDVKITAIVPPVNNQNQFINLYGYTSPLAQITLEGIGVFDQTYADNEGYFSISGPLLSFSSREACLISKDQLGRLSSPVCLPPFPVGKNVSVGPVIMPPTISLNRPNYYMGDQVILSGQAVPNTEVKLSVFGEDKKNSSFTFIRPVEAFTFPELIVKSDNKGNYSINLPSSNPKKFRLFAQTSFLESFSADSINLNFNIFPIWMIIIKYFLIFYSLLKPRLLEIIILTEIIYIICLLKNHYKQKAIVLHQNTLPMIGKTNLLSIQIKKSLIKY